MSMGKKSDMTKTDQSPTKENADPNAFSSVASTTVLEDKKPEINSKKIRLALGDIDYARDRIFAKIQAKAEEESIHSKKKKNRRKSNATGLGPNSIGTGSFNNTLDLRGSPDIISPGITPMPTASVSSLRKVGVPDLNFNQSIVSMGGQVNLNNYTKPTNPMGGPPSKVNQLMEKLKPRDFAANPKMLSLLNVQDYDRMADLNQLHLLVEKQIMDKLKHTWKTMDENKLVYLLKKQIISEILKLEERKHVRQEEKRLDQRRRRAREMSQLNTDRTEDTKNSPFRAGSQ